MREKGLVNYPFVLMSLSRGHLMIYNHVMYVQLVSGFNMFQPPKHQRKQKNSSLSISKNTPENMQPVRYAMVLLVPMVTLAMDSSEGSSGDYRGSNQSTFYVFLGRIRLGKILGSCRKQCLMGILYLVASYPSRLFVQRMRQKTTSRSVFKVLNQRDQRTNGAVFEYH